MAQKPRGQLTSPSGNLGVIKDVGRDRIRAGIVDRILMAPPDSPDAFTDDFPRIKAHLTINRTVPSEFSAVLVGLPLTIDAGVSMTVQADAVFAIEP